MREFLLGIVDTIFPPPSGTEMPSPKIRITPEQAHQLEGLIRTVPGYENCFVAAIAPTNSMEPGVDDGMYVLLDPSIPYTDLVEGDIIWWYLSEQAQAIHRIIKLGNDGLWYCWTKGDNNGRPDPNGIRLEHIKATWRGTLN